MITVGMATRTPRPSVMPRFAFRVPTAVSGPGCGGTRPCIADRPASVGMAIFIRGRPERRATSEPSVQPVASTRPFKNGAASTIPPPAANRPNANGASRGKARRVAPICSGTSAVASPIHAGKRNRNTV